MQSAAFDFELHVTSRGIHLPWHTIENLAKQIRSDWTAAYYVPERLFALGKGAMIPARLLAKERTPVYYVGVQSYKGQEQSELVLYQGLGEDVLYEDLNDPGTLIVDDLWDTGETFRWAKSRWPKAKTAALLSKKPREQTDLDYCALFLPLDSWIIFPWEK